MTDMMYVRCAAANRPYAHSALTLILKGGEHGDMTYRHEWKHEISLSDMITLRHRLQAVAQADEHTTGGTYKIRSLYFDDPSDRVLREVRRYQQTRKIPHQIL